MAAKKGAGPQIAKRYPPYLLARQIAAKKQSAGALAEMPYGRIEYRHSRRMSTVIRALLPRVGSARHDFSQMFSW